ncbi:hypothetical protein [Vreelandella rituensis]
MQKLKLANQAVNTTGKMTSGAQEKLGNMMSKPGSKAEKGGFQPDRAEQSMDPENASNQTMEEALSLNAILSGLKNAKEKKQEAGPSKPTLPGFKGPGM